MIVTRRESIHIDKLFPDMYKEILELVAKKALIHLTTETSSIQQFLPDLKGCISKLEKTVEETKIILEGTGQIKPHVGRQVCDRDSKLREGKEGTPRRCTK